MYKPSNTKSALHLLLFICLLAIMPLLQAQNRINMPYSIFGVGEIHFNNYYQNLGMGGISQGYRSNMSVNDVNPASYTAVDTTSFVFDATMVSHFYRQQTDAISQDSDYISLGNISFAFPVTRRWAVGAGLKPYSLMGYNIRDVEEHEDAGTINYLYEGSGGLSQLFIGTAIQPVGNLSLGVNASYVFGKLNREASVSADSPGVYQTNKLETDHARGWILGFGMQYEFSFSANRNLIIGATYGHQDDIKLSSTDILRRRIPGVNVYDTISKIERIDDVLSLPRYYGVGMFSRINRNWSAGLDYQWQNWENFDIPHRQSDFNNSYRVAAGIEFRPTVETYSPFYSRMQYSAGIRYGQSYVYQDSDPLNEFGISFGVFIPVRRVFSGLNVGFEYSQRGTLDSHPMQENFYRLNIGINVYERWFIRRRFF